MAETVILCNLSDTVKTIDEEREKWMYDVLSSLGVNDSIFSLPIDQFRDKMEEIGVEVELFSNGDVNIYKKQWHRGKTEERSGWLPSKKENIIAQWKKPRIVKRIDGKYVYNEIHINEWSAINPE